MAKIAIIGAGGFQFPLRLVGDILSFPALRGSTISLMDIDPERLQVTADNVRQVIAHHHLPARLQVTTDRREALTGADYVIVTFQVGGLDAYQIDVELPRQFGIDQPVGDTLGPGGVMRFLRSAVVYRELAADMLELCPEALLLNYANPMAMSCWYLSRLGVKVVGLCHSVQGTTRMLAQQAGVPYEELRFVSAGINHQAWLLELRRGQQDIYPLVRRVMVLRHLKGQMSAELNADSGEHSQPAQQPNIYEGAQEAVRTAVMDMFGYFNTESSHHTSEYLPYFRKDAAMVERYIPQRWDYYQLCCTHDGDKHEGLLASLLDELKPSLEYGAVIINATETNIPAVIYGNVPNTRLIENLLPGCCVEVACLVDGSGVQPIHVGRLPTPLAALNRSNINVQELAVEAAFSGERAQVRQAIALDPLTSSLLTLDQISQLTDALLAAQAQWLPQFAAPAAEVKA